MRCLSKKENRDQSFDNIRAMLMICVVFAHLLEVYSPFSFGGMLYKIIYTFHMPVFLFVCGWFAKYDKTKLVFGLFCPYLLFQTAYIFFQRALYGTDVKIQFTTPYWLLWFLLALFMYHLLLPLYDVDSPKKRVVVWLGVLVMSLLSGYDTTIGYSMTLSRFFVFQPWFLLGFYARRTDVKAIPSAIKKVIVLLLELCILVFCYASISNKMLYGSYSYEAAGFGAGTRLYLACLALLWILLFFFVIRPLVGIRIPIITALGQNTLPVFILHGFIVKFIEARYMGLLTTPIRFLAVTCLILLVTGNSVTAWMFRYLIPEYWVKKLKKGNKTTMQ